MKKQRKQKRQISNKLVAYYIEKKWDTPLDSIEIQKKRVNEWAEKAGCEIFAEIIDHTGNELEKAFLLSAEEDGSVICASQSRAANTALDYFNLIEDKDNPIVFSDVDDYSVNWLTNNVQNGLIYGLMMPFYERYVQECEKYLK